MTKTVWFYVNDYAAMREYCNKHGLKAPEKVCDQIHGGDVYKAAPEVWEPLYRNLPYCVTGCFCM